VRSSHKETLLVNEQDKRTISENNIDFTDIKITCLGDSITQAGALVFHCDTEPEEAITVNFTRWEAAET